MVGRPVQSINESYVTNRLGGKKYLRHPKYMSGACDYNIVNYASLLLHYSCLESVAVCIVQAGWPDAISWTTP